MKQRTRTGHLRPRDRALLARLIRAITIFERNCWVGKQINTQSDARYGPGQYWKSTGSQSDIWKSLADAFHELNVGVHSYIYYVHTHVDFLTRPPLPKELFPGQRLGEFQEFVEATNRKLSWQFKRAIKNISLAAVERAYEYELSELYADAGQRMNEATLSVLLEPSREIPELVRYAVGHKFNIAAVRREMFCGAAIEYSRGRESYDEVCSFFLPQDLRERLLCGMELVLKSETACSVAFSRS